MQVHRRDTIGNAEPWVEIDDFEIFTLDQGYSNEGTVTIEPTCDREIVVAISGELVVETAHGRVTLKRRDWLEIPRTGATLTSMRSASTQRYASSRFYPCEVLRIGGHWKDINHVAIFQFRPDRPLEIHYHDFNEYWFVFRGHFTGYHDDEKHEFRPGDMLATRTGHEHGAPDVPETIEGVGFQTTLEGLKRQGHLTRAEHGPPTPL